MGTRTLTAEDRARIAEVAQDWGKIIVRRAFGDQGSGLDGDLAQLDQVAQAAARGLTALSDDGRLARHNEQRPGSAFRRQHKREPRQAA